MWLIGGWCLGMDSEYLCDTEVNLCYSSPCGGNGTCIQKEGGYHCICEHGFTGMFVCTCTDFHLWLLKPNAIQVYVYMFMHLVYYVCMYIHSGDLYSIPYETILLRCSICIYLVYKCVLVRRAYVSLYQYHHSCMCSFICVYIYAYVCLPFLCCNVM